MLWNTLLHLYFLKHICSNSQATKSESECFSLKWVQNPISKRRRWTSLSPGAIQIK